MAAASGTQLSSVKTINREHQMDPDTGAWRPGEHAPVWKVFISCSMTWLAKLSIKLVNFGPPGERNRDATTFDPVLPSS